MPAFSHNSKEVWFNEATAAANAIIAKQGIGLVRIRDWGERNLDALRPAGVHIKRLFVNCAVQDLSAIGTFTNLEELSIRTGLGTIDFAALGKLKQLSVAERTADFRGVARAEALESLEISYSHLKDLTALGELTRLKKLDISEGPLRSLEGIRRLPQLEHLSLHHLKLESLDGLTETRSLRKLGLGALPGLTSIAEVARCSGLTLLGLGQLRKVNDVHVIGRLTRLDYLSLDQLKLGDAAYLEKLTKLRTLRILNIKDVPTLRFIRSMPLLEKFNATDSVFLDGDMSPLLEHPSLREVFFEDRRGYSATLDEVQAAMKARG